MKSFLTAVLLALLLPLCWADEKKKEEPKPAQSIPELQQQIEKILKDGHTPGVSIAIVHRDGPEWVTALGKADVAQNRPATAETLFRIGSTSKAFTSFSILWLADQGKLSLDDPVRKIAPEVWFENKWEATDPIRVVQLLEHTTGWDDTHLVEYARDVPPSVGIKESLDFYHGSRISRWRPGTRMAYCNSGPGVAGYLIEKVTGQRFEDFVQQHLFNPIGMKTATFFPPPPGTETKLYHPDGKTPYPYWNVMFRPAGSINASAQDMAAYVQFHLNRGAVNGVQVVPPADLDRMEVPASTWASRDGLKAGYGLSNYWSIHDGFVYHGHNGGVAGGLTDMSYIPEHGVGYFYSINSANPDVFEKVGKAIRAYITAKLQRPAVPQAAPLPSDAATYEGWYRPDSPRVELINFLERLLGLTRVHFRDGKLVASHLGDLNDTFVPIEGRQFRHVPQKESADPVANTILIAPNPEGQFIQLDMQQTLQRIPTWVAILEILLTIYFLLSFVAILLYAPFWLLGGLSRKRRRPAERAMRVWPLISALSLLGFTGVFMMASDDLIPALGNVTFWSMSLFLTTVLFAAGAVLGAIAIWRAPADGVRTRVRLFSKLVTLALLIATIYLTYWGVIGMRTWV